MDGIVLNQLVRRAESIRRTGEQCTNEMREVVHMLEQLKNRIQVLQLVVVSLEVDAEYILAISQEAKERGKQSGGRRDD